MQQNLYQSCYSDRGALAVSVPVFSKADEQVTAKQSMQVGAQLHSVCTFVLNVSFDSCFLHRAVTNQKTLLSHPEITTEAKRTI